MPTLTTKIAPNVNHKSLSPFINGILCTKFLANPINVVWNKYMKKLALPIFNKIFDDLESMFWACRLLKYKTNAIPVHGNKCVIINNM